MSETQPTQPASNAKNNLGIPVAIVIAAALIAGAIFFSNQGPVVPGNTQGTDPEEQTEIEVAPVTENDHIRGNPNAPIMIVEYSDYDCPFCKSFHETMERIMTEYGTDGKVAWVYRHFPLEQLHPDAPMIAEASECVAELGGNDAFWTFSDLIFSERDTNELTDITRLPEFAVTAGVDQAAFESCVASGKYTDKVNDSISEGIRAGAQGTPYSIVLVGDQQGVINGAQPYNTVRSIVENILSQIEGGA